MVFINEKYKVIFVENPKCASSTILNALIRVLDSDYHRDKLPEEAHLTSRQIQVQCGPEIWNGYLKVSTSRDPFKRFKSSLMFSKHKSYCDKLDTFENVEEHLKNNNGCPYCIRQEEFTDGMDIILDMDNLQTDFDNLCIKLGVNSIELLKTNTNTEFNSLIRSDKLTELFDLYTSIPTKNLSSSM